jgi:hypothetical protein
MCPKCRNFTNAPVGQKHRKCSYCGKIIDISKAASAIFDTPEMAVVAVKEFNASRGGDAFEKAVEKSRERLQSLIPSDELRSKDVESTGESVLPSGKGKRLMRLLEKEAKSKPCSLDRIESLCKEYHLDWVWVEDQLTKLSNRGLVVFPRPWTVKLVQESAKESGTEITVDVSKDILELLKKSGGKLHFDELVEHFGGRGVSVSSVESSLNNLMNQGSIYEPRSGLVSLI